MEEFDNWNEIKKNTHNSDNPLNFREGDIWWIKVGKNIGVEILGKGENFLRPVFVLRKINRFSCIIIPVTKTKNNNIFYYSIRFVKKFGQTSEITLGKVKEYFISIIK